MNTNSLGFSTPRALALGTVAVTLGLSMASGVFSTFSPTILSGNTCAPGYGYDNAFGYGYGYGDKSGYDCTVNPVVVTPGGGGGGGSSSSSSSASPTGTPTTIPLTPQSIGVLIVDGPIVARDIAGSPFKSAIEVLIRAGIMNNVIAINPNRNISRGEFLKLLAISNGYKTPVKVTKRFTDLPAKNTLLPYINFGVSLGWVNTQNSKFRPNDIISQGEIDKLIAVIKGTANADTDAKKSGGVVRGKAASDIVAAFFTR